MRFLTQTNVSPGNCWQTCVAMLLDVDPEALPAQVKEVDGKPVSVPSYMNKLNSFLFRHYGFHYVCVHATEINGLLSVYGQHPQGLYTWEGETVRTPTNNSDHVVVARGDSLYWDPHPSRAGLTEVKRWGLLAPPGKSSAAYWERRIAEGDEDLKCVCPKCETSSSTDGVG